MPRINISISDEVLAELDYLEEVTGFKNRSKLIALGVKLLSKHYQELKQKHSDLFYRNIKDELNKLLTY